MNSESHLNSLHYVNSYSTIAWTERNTPQSSTCSGAATSFTAPRNSSRWIRTPTCRRGAYSPELYAL